MTKRKAHVIQATRGNDRPSNIIFYDTETTELEAPGGVKSLVLRLGYAVHARTIKEEKLVVCKAVEFHASGSFWRFVDERARSRTTTYIVAHNVVFDLVVLNGFMELLELGWELKGFYTKGMTSIFRWSKGSRRIIAIDNANLFPGALEGWGRMLDKPKVEVDFKTCSDEELMVRCRRDVEIMVDLWRLWFRFLDTHDLGAFKPTVGSTAFNAYRRRWMMSKIYCHDDELALRLERDAYRGSRCEVLFQGRSERGNFYYLDVNNMYGYVLRRYEYPAGFYGSATDASLSLLIRKLERYSVVAEVTVNVNENLFPLSQQGHTCYPLGWFRTTLTTPELYEAARRGWLVDCHALAWYRPARLFAGYVKYFSALRQQYKSEDNPGFAEICKLLINSLYGKFGQQGFEQRIIGETASDSIYSMTVLDAVTGLYARHIAVAGHLYLESKTGESYHSSPAIAAHVTAYARLHLARLAHRVTPGHLYYMDTDSLIVDEVGLSMLRELIDPDEVGALKVEQVSPWLEINAPKDYRMENRIRLKGIRPGSPEVRPGEFLTDEWSRFNGMVERGDVTDYNIKRIVKRQRRTIFSGMVTASGWVQPFRLAPPEGWSMGESWSVPCPPVSPGEYSQLEP